MAEWEDKIERMQADGTITVHDADEVRNFVSFLGEAKGPKTGGTEEEVWARRINYARHYPEDFQRAYPDLYAETVARMDDPDGEG